MFFLCNVYLSLAKIKQQVEVIQLIITEYGLIKCDNNINNDEQVFKIFRFTVISPTIEQQNFGSFCDCQCFNLFNIRKNIIILRKFTQTIETLNDLFLFRSFHKSFYFSPLLTKTIPSLIRSCEENLRSKIAAEKMLRLKIGAKKNSPQKQQRKKSHRVKCQEKKLMAKSATKKISSRKVQRKKSHREKCHEKDFIAMRAKCGKKSHLQKKSHHDRCHVYF